MTNNRKNCQIQKANLKNTTYKGKVFIVFGFKL